jgi:hypothetical protein
MEKLKKSFFSDNEIVLKKLLKKFIKAKQEIFDQIENKLPGDKIFCFLCKGKYTRCSKCIHDKTKKHSKCFDELYKSIFPRLTHQLI